MNEFAFKNENEKVKQAQENDTEIHVEGRCKILCNDRKIMA